MLQRHHFTGFFLNCKSIVLVKRVLFLLNAALAIEILHLISQVHLPSFVKMLPKYLKDSTISSCFLHKQQQTIIRYTLDFEMFQSREVPETSEAR